MAWIQGAARAGRSRARRNSPLVQEKEKRLCFHSPDADIDIVRETLFGIPIQTAVRDLRRESSDEVVPHPPLLLSPLLHRPKGSLRGSRKSRNGSHILRSRPPSAFLLSSVEVRRELHAAPHIEEPDSLRTADLVGARGEKVDAGFSEREGKLPEGLDCIRMKKNSLLSRDFRDLRDRLDRPDLIVCAHDADEPGFIPYGFQNGSRLYPPPLIDIQISDGKSPLFEIGAASENGVMLDLRADDMTLPRGFDPGNQRPVVGLRAAPRKIELHRTHAHKLRELPPALLHSPFRPLREEID